MWFLLFWWPAEINSSECVVSISPLHNSYAYMAIITSVSSYSFVFVFQYFSKMYPDLFRNSDLELSVWVGVCMAFMYVILARWPSGENVTTDYFSLPTYFFNSHTIMKVKCHGFLYDHFESVGRVPICCEWSIGTLCREKETHMDRCISTFQR